MNDKKPLFDLGQIVATPDFLEELRKSGETAAKFLQRHVTGDYGDLCEEDRLLNEQAVRHGDRIFSAYRLTTGVKIWIITEAIGDDGKRASTCCMLPENY
jgi:hypothetical protein